MILSEIKSDVQDLLQDTDADEALITKCANWYVNELCTNNHLRIMEDSEELSASQGDTELEFPENMKTLIKEGFYLTSPQVFDMGPNYISYGEFMRNYANFASATQAQASQWTDFGNKARFAAPLNAEHTFQCDFLRDPVDMEEDDDLCEIPDRYREMVAKGTLARMMKINEDYAEASQEISDLESLETAFKKNESRGSFKTGPNVIRTNRGRGSWRADRDF